MTFFIIYLVKYSFSSRIFVREIQLVHFAFLLVCNVIGKSIKMYHFGVPNFCTRSVKRILYEGLV